VLPRPLRIKRPRGQNSTLGVSAPLTPHRGLRFQATVAAVILGVSVVALSSWPSDVPARPLPAQLQRLRSGLVMADPLDHQLSASDLGDQYVLDGSAGARLGWAYETSSGLLVGVKAHSGWAGWFAVTVHAAGPSVAWHTNMAATALPPGTKGRGIAVFAVQTGTTQRSGAINYIVVGALTVKREYRWVIGYAHGIVAGATTNLLWKSRWYPDGTAAAFMQATPVTVVTNGYHSVAVWIGGKEVLHRAHLAMDIPPPFQAYLEVQSSAPAYAARFTNFWVADEAPLEVSGVAARSPVSLVGAGGHVLARATANASGMALLSLPMPELAGTGALRVNLVHGGPGRAAGTSRSQVQVAYSGGDILHFGH